MFVLGMPIGESLKIGENIKLNFIKVKENTVRVAIDLPREVPVLRDGVEDKEKAKNSDFYI